MITTLGAIVFTRADVATVQFCHHGFVGAGKVTRRGGPRRADQLNQWLASRAARAMERWCYRPGRVRTLVAVSNTIAAELAGAFPPLADDIIVVPNGVDVSHFKPDAGAVAATRRRVGLPASGKVVIFVGGDWERKGLAVMVDVLARSREWHLLVVGLGDEPHYQALAEAAGVGGRVTFAGVHADTAPFFAAADAFALPTRYEGFALVSLEAAATGLPLLVTAAAGADGLVTPGVNGWILERDPAAFATALEALHDDAVVRRMGAAARVAAHGFDWVGIGDAHAELYRAIRRGRGHRRSVPETAGA